MIILPSQERLDPAGVWRLFVASSLLATKFPSVPSIRFDTPTKEELENPQIFVIGSEVENIDLGNFIYDEELLTSIERYFGFPYPIRKTWPEFNFTRNPLLHYSTINMYHKVQIKARGNLLPTKTPKTLDQQPWYKNHLYQFGKWFLDNHLKMCESIDMLKRATLVQIYDKYFLMSESIIPFPIIDDSNLDIVGTILPSRTQGTVVTINDLEFREKLDLKILGPRMSIKTWTPESYKLTSRCAVTVVADELRRLCGGNSSKMTLIPTKNTDQFIGSLSDLTELIKHKNFVMARRMLTETTSFSSTVRKALLYELERMEDQSLIT